MLSKEDSSAPQEQLQKPQSTSASCRTDVCARQFQLTVLQKIQALMSHFVCSCRPKAIMLKVSRFQNPVSLIMNLAYWLKPHHTRNMYLWAWLDTCTDMNIMPASVYQLVFKDPEMKKLQPCKMQISTYTAHTVKIIGSCKFGIVHPDTKKLMASHSM